MPDTIVPVVRRPVVRRVKKTDDDTGKDITPAVRKLSLGLDSSRNKDTAKLSLSSSSSNRSSPEKSSPSSPSTPSTPSWKTASTSSPATTYTPTSWKTKKETSPIPKTKKETSPTPSLKTKKEPSPTPSLKIKKEPSPTPSWKAKEPAPTPSWKTREPAPTIPKWKTTKTASELRLEAAEAWKSYPVYPPHDRADLYRDIETTTKPRKTSRDLALETKVLQWIMSIIHEQPSTDYEHFIQDGYVLSKVMTSIVFNSVPLEVLSDEWGSNFAQNRIRTVIREIRKYGVVENFEVDDLIQLKNIPKVTKCLAQLSKLAASDKDNLLPANVNGTF